MKGRAAFLTVILVLIGLTTVAVVAGSAAADPGHERVGPETDGGLPSLDLADGAAESNATENASIEFVEDASGESGDVIDVPISLEHADAGYVQLVDYDGGQFKAVTGFETDGNSVGEAILQFNTYAPADEASWNVHGDYEDDVSLTETRYATAPADERLAADEYGMVAGLQLDDTYETPVIESGYDTDTSTVTVDEPTPPTNITTSIAPIDADLEGKDEYRDATITNRSAVAAGDSLLVTVEDFGYSGLVREFDGGESLDEELGGEMVELTIVEQVGWWYVESRVWSTDSDVSAPDDDVYHVDATVVSTDYERYDGDLMLELEYDDTEHPLDVGGYDLQYAVDENSSLVDNEVELETEFEVVEPTLEWTEDAKAVSNDANATVTGTTNIAPGSSITTSARAADAFTAAADAVVEADGSFTAGYDFSEYEHGLEFELQAYPDAQTAYEADGALMDEVSSVLASVLSASIDLDVDAPAEVEAGDAASLGVTVENEGNESVDVDITVVIDDEEVEDTTVSLEAGERWLDRFVVDTDGGSDVEWLVAAGDVSDSDTLQIVGEDDDEPLDVDADEATEADTADVDDEWSDPAEDEDEDEMPGFGAAVAVLALLVTAGAALFGRS
ncbi:BGTF surface domain-containing protein [Natronobacterium gregoryi]|uniref:PGF-CTERM sorting domain-containing protein n=1 Tax=Natronobacterium gregoryi (strain ATCC 43098 / DSM 3393 / CCM 3738 / CIP 104747 / IAM 13177 / JCM 8860 / NBRC 102187 / NCIMB 2189 / SP2) TaxID=797304 RepID=L9Y790_NATGS|nr:BGTF surface domain-containing protein [Natronobacterium gregoryi]ELY68803.1 hypothetical protein C490_08961 [Natronobacterium gregoryi SP2]PLK18246.1 hypothetical protein CYV19_18475 [Natronobacterium gregoryi SP2]